MSAGEGLQINCPFKPEGGDSNREGNLEPSSQHSQTEGAPGQDAQSIKHQQQTLFLNPNPFLWWYGVENVAQVRINGESCMTLLNNGVQINMVTPNLVEECSLEVGPLIDYDKDQITLVIPDLSNFVVRVHVILGTLQ